MSESAFQASWRQFQERTSGSPRPAAGPGSGGAAAGSGGAFSAPSRWLSSIRAGGTPIPVQDEDREGLLSGLTSSANTSGCFGMSMGQRLMAFGCCTGGGILMFFMSFFMLPMVALSPQKFAFLSCLGSLLLFASMFFLRGWFTHLKAVFSKDRWPFSAGYIGSLLGGLYSSVIAKNYLLTLLFIIIHTVALVWYYFSFLPGGTSGLRAMTGMMFGGRGSLLPV